MTMNNIKPTTNNIGYHKTGQLRDITKHAIITTLGFEPNIEDDPTKVENSWCFEIDGKRFGVWDYLGSHQYNIFSTFGDSSILKQIFGKAYHD